jgi:hypothetical protein
MRLLLAILIVTACSDCELAPSDKSIGTSDDTAPLDDTGSLPDCDGFPAPAAPAPAMDKTCVNEPALGPHSITKAEWGTGSLVAIVDPEDGVPECDEDDNLLDLGIWPCPASAR